MEGESGRRSGERPLCSDLPTDFSKNLSSGTAPDRLNRAGNLLDDGVTVPTWGITLCAGKVLKEVIKPHGDASNDCSKASAAPDSEIEFSFQKTDSRVETDEKKACISEELPVNLTLSCSSRANKLSRDNHSSDEDLPRCFFCPTCNKQFSHPSSLKIHIGTHTGETPFKCKNCGKGFTQSGNLKVHMHSHTGETPFRCAHCGQGFPCASRLKIHMRSHTGLTPFVCPICSKGFINSSNLQGHIRTHTGERPYWCTACPKKFTQASSLKVHMRTHTGEKPYVCPVCDKGFATKGNLTVHRLMHNSSIEPVSQEK